MLAYVVAEELGVEVSDVRVVTADTDLTPVDLGSYSSRVTLMTGNAAIQAARRLKPLLLAMVSKGLDVPPERLRMAHRRVFDAKDPEKGMTFAEAVVLTEAEHGTLGSTGSYKPPRSAARYKGAGVGPSPTYSYSVCVVELQVDEETGWVTIDKIWIAHDVGKAINPLLTIGQIEGSVYMGLGEALMEGAGLPVGGSQVPLAARVQEPDLLGNAAGGVHSRRNPRPARAVRRQGVRARPTTPGHPRTRQCHLRCGRGSSGRGSGNARQNPLGHGRAFTLTRGSYFWFSRTARGATLAGIHHGGGAARMMRLPPFRYLAPSEAREAAAYA